MTSKPKNVDEDRPQVDRTIENAHAGSHRRSASASAYGNSYESEKTGAFDQANSERKMTKPPRSNKSEFSKREIVLFILVMIVATILTVEATNFILKTFVLGSPNDPLTKAGGLSTSQERETRKGK